MTGAASVGDYKDFFVATAAVGGTLWILGPTLVLALVQSAVRGFPMAILFMGSAAVAVANGFFAVVLFSLAGLAPDLISGPMLMDRLGVMVSVGIIFVFQIALVVGAITEIYRDKTAKGLRFVFVMLVLAPQASVANAPTIVALMFGPVPAHDLAHQALVTSIGTIASVVFLSAIVIWMRLIGEQALKSAESG